LYCVVLLESTAKLDTVNHQVGGVFLNITQVKFEDTKEAIISRRLKKYSQYNDQQKKDKK